MTDTTTQQKALGRLPAKADIRAVHLRAVTTIQEPPPKRVAFWKVRRPFEPASWGNTEHGCCTIAKQANMFRRFERLEQKRTIVIAEAAVLATYYAMTAALYGGGDTGAYETDALAQSRKPETAIRDLKDRPMLIDAYVRVDAWDQVAVRQAMYLSAGHGLAICINLPNAFSRINPPEPWDLPEGQALTGDWQPGSWGGHSMWAIDYSEEGLLLEHTWGIPPQLLTWRAAAAYMDECHLVIDQVDAWRKRHAETTPVRGIMANIVDAVNAVSSTKIKMP